MMEDSNTTEMTDVSSSSVASSDNVDNGLDTTSSVLDNNHIDISAIIDGYEINTSDLTTDTGVAIENCLNDDAIKSIKERAKREASYLNLDETQAKQLCQNIYDHDNYIANVNMRDNLERQNKAELEWSQHMEESFGKKDSIDWGNNMDKIQQGADIAVSCNMGINEGRLKDELDALKSVGFSEVLKVFQTCHELYQQNTELKNQGRASAFYGSVEHNTELNDNPNIAVYNASRRNREIFNTPDWKNNTKLRQEVAKNDAIISKYRIYAMKGAN